MVQAACDNRYKMFTGSRLDGQPGQPGEAMPTEGNMPQIIVTADRLDDDDELPVMYRERVNVSDFESSYFAGQLMERIGWAVGDADALNLGSARRAERRRAQRRLVDATQRELAHSAHLVRSMS